MNQSDIIKGLRLQQNSAEPSVQFISNLKGKLMKKINGKKGFTLPFWGALTFGVIGIVALAMVLTSQGKVNVPLSVQGNPTTTTSPTVTPSEETPVKVKEVYKEVLIKSIGKYVRFYYPENTPIKAVSDFNKGSDDDEIVVTSGGKDVLRVGINWLGWTQGNIPLKSLAKVETRNLGTLYRWQINLPDMGGYWGYSSSKDVILTGKCAVFFGFPESAPCAKTDQIFNSKTSKTQMLFTCMPGKEKLCDILVKGFEIR